MHYDDRLATVLRPRVAGAVPSRIQYHQLLDLLGTSPAGGDDGLIDQAYARLAELSSHIPQADRLVMLREPALRLRSPRLIAALAQCEPQVAGAAVRAAQLSDEQWLDLIPALPFAARAAMRRRDIGAPAHDLLARLGVGDLPLPSRASIDAYRPSTPAPPAPPAQPAAAQVDAPPGQTIGAIVRRIEAFRRARDAAAANLAPGDSPQLPLGDENAPDASPRDAPAVVQSFDFSTDPAGRIVWSDPQIAPMVAGIALGDIAGLGALILQHQPVRAVRVVLDGAPAIAGGWQVDASPGFDPQSGGFIGHLGRFRRRADVAASPGQDSPIDGSEHAGSEHASSEIDRLRQLLHELRTPVNAIQGFAEIIQQQLFGPTPHEYRALAAAVAADAAHMLAGFEELERFARLGNMDMELSAGESDLGACVAATVARLQAHTGPRGNDFVLEAPGAVLRVAMAPIETERLCWRLLATLAGSANPGETLRLDVRGLGDQAKVTLQLPETLSKLDDEVLLHTGAGAAAHSLAAGMFGTGFALRLAAREAAAAGGRLERAQGNLNLFLPMLAEAAPTQSDADAGGHPDEMKQATQSGA